MRFLPFFNHDKFFRASFLTKTSAHSFMSKELLSLVGFTLIPLARIEGDTEASGAPGWPPNVPWGHLDSVS